MVIDLELKRQNEQTHGGAGSRLDQAPGTGTGLNTPQVNALGAPGGGGLQDVVTYVNTHTPPDTSTDD